MELINSSINIEFSTLNNNN